MSSEPKPGNKPLKQKPKHQSWDDYVAKKTKDPEREFDRSPVTSDEDESDPTFKATYHDERYRNRGGTP